MMPSGYERPTPAARGDWKALRATGEAALAAMEAALPEHSSVSRADYQASSHDGVPVPLRWYGPRAMTLPAPAPQWSTCTAAG
jgi:hypothetical protein